jgi:hypothetical protein
MRTRGTGKVVRSHPHVYLVRFTDDEHERIQKMLRRRRLSNQQFGHAAMIRAINEIELGKQTKQEILQDIKKDQEHQQTIEPSGLGIRERLQESRDRDEARRTHLVREEQRNNNLLVPAPLPAVNSDEIAALARTIVDSPKTARKEILQAACRTLARGRTEAETMRVAEDLNAAIRCLEAPQSALERVRARSGR